MPDILIKKKKLELMKVEAAKLEMEIKIEKFENDIQKLKDNIEIQNKRISELTEEIQGGK